MRVVPHGTEVRQDGMLPADEKPSLRCIIASAAALKSDPQIIFKMIHAININESFYADIYYGPDYINR